RRGSARTVVVHVDYGHAFHADTVDGALAARAVAIDISGHDLPDVGDTHAGILERFPHGGLRELRVRLPPAGRDERRHTDARDPDTWFVHRPNSSPRRCASRAIESPT